MHRAFEALPHRGSAEGADRGVLQFYFRFKPDGSIHSATR